MALGCVRVDLTVRLGRGVEGFHGAVSYCLFELFFNHVPILNRAKPRRIDSRPLMKLLFNSPRIAKIIPAKPFISQSIAMTLSVVPATDFMKNIFFGGVIFAIKNIENIS